MVKAILFDLDGTLLPLNQDLLIEIYFKTLGAHLAKNGFDVSCFKEAMWRGIEAMLKNNGEKTNEERFFDSFSRFYGEDVRKNDRLLLEYYEKDFDMVKASCAPTPKANECIERLKSDGYQIIIATNPVFPSVATYKRLSWAGIDLDGVSLVTTYENSSFCKPKLEYYIAILEKFGLKAEECVMVGNDTGEDMVAQNLGMKVFLLPECLINSAGEDTDKYPQGDFCDLYKYIKSL